MTAFRRTTLHGIADLGADARWDGMAGAYARVQHDHGTAEGIVTT
jgi:hypothetical protein